MIKARVAGGDYCRLDFIVQLFDFRLYCTAKANDHAGLPISHSSKFVLTKRVVYTARNDVGSFVNDVLESCPINCFSIMRMPEVCVKVS